MTYAKRILSILLVLCVLCNMAITVFASDTDSGGEASSPVDTVADELASEDPPPDQGEDPPDVLTDENKEPSQEETAQLETNEEDTENPTETEEPSPSSETVEESSAPEESIATEESVEENSEPVYEDASAEESSEPLYEDASAEESTEPATEADPVEEPETPEAQITAVNGRAETKASGVSIVHCGNAINTNGTLTISYYNYLEGANKTAYIQAIEEKRINGAVAFCLAPEVGSQGTNYTKDEQMDAWNKMPRAMREAITLVMAYGYPHVSYSASTDDIYWYGKQTMLDGENYIATQLIIWEFLSGVRNSVTFELTGSTSYRNVCDSGWNSIRTTYDAIVTKLKNHNAIPAYASRSQGAYVYELKYDSSTGTYRYLLPTERQSDWRNCRMTLPDGITYLKKSDNMTVIGFEATPEAAKALPKDGYTVSGESPYVSVDPDKAVACWECDNSQTVATMVQKPDPAKAYFTLKLAPEGTMTAKKTSSSGDVAGYCFKFYSSATDTTWYAKTDASGNLCLSNSSYSTLGSKEFSHLPEGDYTLTEVLSKKGKDLVFPDKWTVKVTDADGKVTTKTYTSADMTKASNGDCILKNVNITGLAGGGTITMTINNVSLTERLEIIKTSPNGNVANIEFF
ncbi:MAG: Cys-Gln thioester bond-forming surface protein, partial [Faecousia sp.]